MYYRSFCRHCNILCSAVALRLDMHQKRYFCIRVHRSGACPRRSVRTDLRLHCSKTYPQTWTCFRCCFRPADVHLHHFRFCSLQQRRSYRLRLAYDARLRRFICIWWHSCVKQEVISLQNAKFCYNVKVYNK